MTVVSEALPVFGRKTAVLLDADITFVSNAICTTVFANALGTSGHPWRSRSAS